MPNAICVLTARGKERILAEGGSQAWVLDARRARGFEYVVCVQNCGFTDDWGQTSAPHHTAFLVGRLRDVVHSEERPERWILRFSEYAEVSVADAWPHLRNPIRYIDLQELGIDVAALEFHPMPEPEQEPQPAPRPAGLTIAEAKEGLALTFGVSPSDIEITVRA